MCPTVQPTRLNINRADGSLYSTKATNTAHHVVITSQSVAPNPDYTPPDDPPPPPPPPDDPPPPPPPPDDPPPPPGDPPPPPPPPDDPPPPPPPPPPDGCNVCAELAKIYQRVDYVYTKSDYIIGTVTAIQNELTLLADTLQATPANTNNPVLAALADIAFRIETTRQSNLAKIQDAITAVGDFRQSSLDKIQDLLDDLTSVKTDVTSGNTSLAALKQNVLSNQQSLLDVAGGVTGVKTTLEILRDIADTIRKDVDELKEPETFNEIVSLGAMIDSGQLLLPPVAIQVLLQNVAIPNGLGRRFSRVSGQPDNFQFGYAWFKTANHYTVEMPIEWKASVFDVPKGSTHFCYWLLPSVKFQASVMNRIEIVNL